MDQAVIADPLAKISVQTRKLCAISKPQIAQNGKTHLGLDLLGHIENLIDIKENITVVGGQIHAVTDVVAPIEIPPQLVLGHLAVLRHISKEVDERDLRRGAVEITLGVGGKALIILIALGPAEDRDGADHAVFRLVAADRLCHLRRNVPRGIAARGHRGGAAAVGIPCGTVSVLRGTLHPLCDIGHRRNMKLARIVGILTEGDLHSLGIARTVNGRGCLPYGLREHAVQIPEIVLRHSCRCFFIVVMITHTHGTVLSKKDSLSYYCTTEWAESQRKECEHSADPVRWARKNTRTAASILLTAVPLAAFMKNAKRSHRDTASPL